MKATFEVKRYIVCPHCEKTTERSVDHLLKEENLPRTFGALSCNHCHEEFKGVIQMDHSIDIEKVFGGSKYLPTMDLLVIPPQDKPIYLLRRGNRTFKPGEVLNDVKDNARYYYNEHSCPTNWMDNFETIAFDGDGDPHGVVRYLNSIMPEDYAKIEAEINAAYGLGNGSSSGDSDYAILVKAFPEVAEQLDPNFIDDGILDLIGDPPPGKRVVSTRVKLLDNAPAGPMRYQVCVVTEDKTEEPQAVTVHGDLAVLIGQHYAREYRVKLEEDVVTKRYLTNL